MPKGKKGPIPDVRDDQDPLDVNIQSELRNSDTQAVADEVDEMLTGEEPEQSALFSEPNPVRRLPRKLSDESIAELNAKIAECTDKKLRVEDDKKASNEAYNSRIKAFDLEIQDYIDHLRHPFVEDNVQCEWRVDLESNSKALVRLDTGDEVERSALTAEDRIQEMQRVEALNQASVTAGA